MEAQNKKNQGFTLIELMIAVAIVAILAAIGYPAYTDQVRKTARKEAAGALLEIAGRMERVRSQRFAYEAVALESTRRYTVTLDIPADGASFTLTATAIGDQAGDMCGNITLSSRGQWTFTQSGNPVDQATCL